MVISRCYNIRVKLAIHDHGGALLQDITSLESKASFILGVGANVQLKSHIPIGAKVEISPKGGLYTMSQG
jgi:hypothetical protein